MACSRISVVTVVVAGVLTAASPAAATALAGMAHWISMRGITEDAAPSFVVAKYASTGAYTTAFAGCDGHTYYLTSADTAVVQASRNAGDTVQIHRAEPGTQAAQSGIVCLVQADQ